MFPSVELYLSESSESDGDDTRLCRRNIRDALNVLDLPEERFIATLRVNKEVFTMLLADIKPKLKVAYRNTHVPAPTKLATLLTFLATGGYQSSVGNEYMSSMSKSMVCNVINELLIIFETYLGPKWIKLQKSLEDENRTKASFFRTAGVPGNRKGYYSINVMLICNEDMVITYVDARHPGANHDAFIWDQSAANYYFKTNYINGKKNTWLLCMLIVPTYVHAYKYVSGYKLQPYVLTPYRNPTEVREKKYNEKHCKARNIIERCNRVLKNRFRCIINSRGLHYSPEKTTKIVNACCVLHNMCIFYKNHWDLNENLESLGFDDNSDDNAEVSSEETAAAKSIRDEVSRNLV